MHYSKYLFLTLILISLFSCKDLEVFEDCDTKAAFVIEKDPDCTPPCEVRFINQSTGATISSVRWTLGDGSPASQEDGTFTHTYDSAGVYNVVLTVFSEGCEAVEATDMVIIGVDFPVAKIEVDRNSCIIDNCLINFSYQPVNASSWTWSFPSDPDTYENQDMFPYTFDDSPGSYDVILTANNGGFSHSDTVTIEVAPATFTLVEDLETGSFEKIICVKEADDGSFYIAGNTKTVTYVAHISRDGQTVLSSKIIQDGLGSNFTVRNAFDCIKTGDNHLIVGTTNWENGNDDVYLVELDPFFNDGLEKAIRPVNDGNEAGHGIAPTADGGYLVCGNKSSANPNTGMLFLKLDQSFERESSFLLFNNSAFNVAYSIVNTAAGFSVVGQALNPGSGNFEGVYFQLDQNFDLLPSETLYYGDYIPRRLIRLNNETNILIGNENQTARVIATGVSNWDVTFGNTEFQKGIISGDGHLVLTGFSGPSNFKTATLIKLNSQSGAVLFERSYPNSGFSRRLYSLSQTADGGFILGGMNEEEPDDKMLLIRTDHNGQL